MRRACAGKDEDVLANIDLGRHEADRRGRDRLVVHAQILDDVMAWLSGRGGRESCQSNVVRHHGKAEEQVFGPGIGWQRHVAVRGSSFDNLTRRAGATRLSDAEIGPVNDRAVVKRGVNGDQRRIVRSIQIGRGNPRGDPRGASVLHEYIQHECVGGIQRGAGRYPIRRIAGIQIMICVVSRQLQANGRCRPRLWLIV